VGIVEDVLHALLFARALQIDPTVFLLPPPLLVILIFPFAGVTRTGLRLDIVPPHVLGAFSVSPDVLARDRTRMTANAFVEVKYHRDL
jgi:hypothetical protein